MRRSDADTIMLVHLSGHVQSEIAHILHQTSLAFLHPTLDKHASMTRMSANYVQHEITHHNPNPLIHSFNLTKHIISGMLSVMHVLKNHSLQFFCRNSTRVVQVQAIEMSALLKMSAQTAPATISGAGPPLFRSPVVVNLAQLSRDVTGQPLSRELQACPPL